VRVQISAAESGGNKGALLLCRSEPLIPMQPIQAPEFALEAAEIPGPV
jgi:hypothetical protein